MEMSDSQGIRLIADSTADPMMAPYMLRHGDGSSYHAL
jgi:hypothetical protein